ncbi:MAG: zinc-dependent alcohol dehydrogenase [Saccharofermentanales bacterium]|jgi:L-iditol 2-dehydrogenase
MGKMKAIVLQGPERFAYSEVDIPEAGEYEVLCRVESVSICGTDVKIIHGEFPSFWPKQFPIVLGHEWSGVIEALGSKSEHFGWKVGDRVCGIANVGCGYCANCQEGLFTLCLNYGNEAVHKMYGHITNGAYAEYIAANIKSIAKIPDDMDFNAAAVMDTFSIALHVVMRSGLQPGDSVLVNGAGAQGWFAILSAKTMGAGMIICSGSGNRLEKAQQLGATPIDYRRDNVVQKVMEMTGGLGVKRVIETTGTVEGIRSACFAVARGGCVSCVGFPREDVPIPVKRLVLDEIDFLGNRGNPNTLVKAINMAHYVMNDIKSLITHEFPLSDYAKALDIFENRLDNSLKVVVKPQWG